MESETPTQTSTGAVATAMTGESLYDDRCAECHGTDGMGDGPAAAALDPKPQDHTDPEWQETVTDQEIAEIIEEGGAAEGLSASMPAHPDLTDRQVESLVEYIRSLESSA